MSPEGIGDGAGGVERRRSGAVVVAGDICYGYELQADSDRPARAAVVASEREACCELGPHRHRVSASPHWPAGLGLPAQTLVALVIDRIGLAGGPFLLHR